jgi:hypothetical protein
MEDMMGQKSESSSQKSSSFAEATADRESGNSEIGNRKSEISAHAEAVEVLSTQVLFWYKQIADLNHSDLPDRAKRAAYLRDKCHAVEKSMKNLEGKETS